jgi:hypothetical protein
MIMPHNLPIDSVDCERFNNPRQQGMRIAIIFLTALSLIPHSIRHYFVVSSIYEFRKTASKRTNSFVSGSIFAKEVNSTKVPALHVQFLLEFLVLAICPLPYYEAWVDQSFLTKRINNEFSFDLVLSRPVRHFLSDYLMLFMFLRLLFLIRSTFNYSIYRDGYSKAICQHYGASSGIRFAFKCFLDQYP